MIPLFNIPNHIIDTHKFSNLLHDSIVTEFECAFAEYVGAKYACSVNSATNAIFLSLVKYKDVEISIPTMLPGVVANAILQSGNKIKFIDNYGWIGSSYVLHNFPDYRIIDSAQRVDKDQFKNEANDGDLIIFSFYPTKPISGCDGGMIVSNDKDKIDWFKTATLNGTTFSENNWDRKIQFPGWKMYMNSIQAYIAYENFLKLEEKKEKLKKIRDYYNQRFGINNTSDHLYRISIADGDKLRKWMLDNDIMCGKHYSCLHQTCMYIHNSDKLTASEKVSKYTISLPFHENLTMENLDYIIKKYSEYYKYDEYDEHNEYHNFN